MKTEFQIIDDSYEVLYWCYEQFGDPYKSKNLWYTFKPSSNSSPAGIYRLFVFYREVDAMAFKLRWA